MTQEPVSELELADWRRRVAALYVEVRALSSSDPAAAAAHWRTVRAQLYREHPQSPVPIGERKTFRAQYFPHDPSLRFEVPITADIAEQDPGAVQREQEGRMTPIPTSMGQYVTMRRLGWIEIPFHSGRRRLALFWMEGYAGGLYLPSGMSQTVPRPMGLGDTSSIAQRAPT